MAKLLTYKGVVFDDYVKDEEYENYWSEICDECFYRHRKEFTNYSYSGSGVACCGVKGCNHKDASIYVDFGTDVEIKEEEDEQGS